MTNKEIVDGKAFELLEELWDIYYDSENDSKWEAVGLAIKQFERELKEAQNRVKSLEAESMEFRHIAMRAVSAGQLLLCPCPEDAPVRPLAERIINESCKEVLALMGVSNSADMPDKSVPVGTIIMVSVPNRLPKNYWECDGRLFNISKYSELNKAIGSHFRGRLPHLRRDAICPPSDVIAGQKAIVYAHYIKAYREEDDFGRYIGYIESCLGERVAVNSREEAGGNIMCYMEIIEDALHSMGYLVPGECLDREKYKPLYDALSAPGRFNLPILDFKDIVSWDQNAPKMDNNLDNKMDNNLDRDGDVKIG